MRQRDSGLYLPPIATAQERNAPKAGVKASIAGWVEWVLVDRNGCAVKGGESSNLWLDQGLESIADRIVSAGVSILGYGGPGSGAYLYGFTHMAVGTSSVAPNVSDTALGNEIARVSRIQTAASASRPSNGEYIMSKTWEFDFGEANGNLTEWGVARESSGGLLTRALFEDALGNPITVTKTSDYKLRIKYSLGVSLSPAALTAGSVVISGIGTLNGEFMFRAGGSNFNADLKVFGDMAAGLITRGMLSTDATVSYATTTQEASSNRASTDTPGAYTPGSYERSASHAWSTNVGNLSGIRQLAVAGPPNGGSYVAGLSFLIDSGDAFTKDNLHNLTLTDLFTVSWNRA